ncbi:MAG: zinc ribbon domain-containing protein [Clostridia bacterium]|nr:zinc ribbon domain-containing protein [Clostridia bacterium]
MGLFGMIGKMAGSKVVEKVEDELTKKQNDEQTSKYCTYIKNNIIRICKLVADLQNDTKTLISEISASKGIRMSFKEKGDLRKTKDKANINLKYLYLSRDFFTALSKNASGLALQNEELMLVTKFAPYFDGVPVLDMGDEDSDESVLGAFKEVGRELMSAFVSSKKSSKHFTFEDYLCRYEEKISECIMPDIDSAIENFKNAMSALDTPPVAVTATPVASIVNTPTAPIEEIECPNCNAKLGVNAKFCLECGNKIEIKKPAFCTQCGEPVTASSKFCANCGAKI